MTLYAGETVRLSTKATKYDGTTPLTPDDIDSAWVVVFDADNVVVLDSTELAWDAASQEWFYDWPTDSSGTYRAKFRLVGIGIDAWEYLRVRLKADPIPTGGS